MTDSSDWFAGFSAADHHIGDVTIHARFGGRADAPPLVLLHGFPQNHTMWQRVAQQLAPHFRLVLPDLRGYGDSSKPPGAPGHVNYSKRTMAGDIAELMGALGHDRYAVCGHDRGGRVAHRLAVDHPARGHPTGGDRHRADAGHVRGHRHAVRHALLPLVPSHPAQPAARDR